MRLPTISLSSLPPSPRHFFFFPHIPQYSKNNFRNCWLEKCVKYIMSINGFINTMFFFFFYFVACSSFTIFNFVIIIWLHHVVEAAINPTIDLPEITQDWGNRLLEGTHRTLCTTGPRRKEQWPHKDWSRLACECPWVSSGSMGQWWPAAGLGALIVAVQAWDILKEATIIFITMTIVWPQVNNRKGTQPHPTTENWIKILLSMAPPIRTRPSFPLSQSLPSGSFHKHLILLQQRTDRLKTTSTEN